MIDSDEEINYNHTTLQVSVKQLYKAVEFLMESRHLPMRDVIKPRLRESLKVFSIMSKKGIPEDIVKLVAVDIVFTKAFDSNVKRRLLYCLVPEKTFPHSILPLAVSTAVSVTISYTMQHSILCWIASLLEYNVINSTNKYIHLCYTALFNLLGKEKICGLVCKILYRITQRYDVSAYRIQAITRLSRKPNLSEKLHPLLRLYKMYRPDLVILSTIREKKFTEVPSVMLESLVMARTRNKNNLEDSEQDLWNQVMQVQKKKSSRSVLVIPEIFVYAATLEEKSKKKISVFQYRRIRDMAKDINNWKDWIWPNSATSLLWKPNLIPLFNPSEVQIMITITNWLEMALKTEILDGRGRMNMKQKETLLSACVSLCRQTGTMIPIFYQFIGQFLISWDKQSFMRNVLELLSCIPFTSDTFFFNDVMSYLVDLFCSAKLTVWCALVDAFSNTACTWAFQEYKEKHFKTTVYWPLAEEQLSPMEGVFYLTKRLERLFLAGLIRFGPISMLLHTCIDYYEKVNMCSEELDLPIYVVPPLEFVIAVIASGDVGAANRCGLFYAKSDITTSRIAHIENEVSLTSVFIANAIHTVNSSVEVFLNFTYSCRGFNRNWMDTIRPYFNDDYMDYLSTLKGLRNCGCIANSLSYLPLSLSGRLPTTDHNYNERKTVENVALLLKAKNLPGIQLCAETFISNLSSIIEHG